MAGTGITRLQARPRPSGGYRTLPVPENGIISRAGGLTQIQPTGLGQTLGAVILRGGCPSHIRFGVLQPTEWQHIGNEIKAAMVFTRAHFVNVDHLCPHNSWKRSDYFALGVCGDGEGEGMPNVS